MSTAAEILARMEAERQRAQQAQAWFNQQTYNRYQQAYSQYFKSAEELRREQEEHQQLAKKAQREAELRAAEVLACRQLMRGIMQGTQPPLTPANVKRVKQLLAQGWLRVLAYRDPDGPGQHLFVTATGRMVLS